MSERELRRMRLDPRITLHPGYVNAEGVIGGGHI
jgi:hypothetical protein